MATIHNNAALARQLTSKSTQGTRGAYVNSLGHDPRGPGAQGAPATEAERNATTYARFKKEYGQLENRLIEGQQLTQANLNRYAALPGLMAQYAPKPDLAIAAPGGAGAAAAAPPVLGRNLPSPGKGLGLGNMFGFGAGASRRRRNRRKSRKNRRRSRKN